MNRRTFLRSAGAGAALAGGGAAWYVYDGQSIYEQPDGPYAAWREWKDVGRGGPASLVGAAVLASSPHNTQPWIFRVADRRVELFLDPKRSVAGLDPFLREAYIGMGCALENAALAAEACGFKPEILVPDGSLSDHGADSPRMVARLDLTVGNRREGELYAAIPNRHTNRGAYDPDKALPRGYVEELRGMSQGEARLMVFEDPAGKEDLVKISTAANRELYGDPEVEDGNQDWIRWKSEDIQRSQDGITIDNFGLPPAMTLAAKTAPSWILKQASAPQRRSEMYEPQMRSARLIGLIAVKDRMSIRQSVEAGRLWQRAHLLATARGVAARPCNEAVEMIDYERWKSRPGRRMSELQKVVGSDWEPTFLFLMGRARIEAGLSPRRRAKRVMVSAPA